LSIMGPEASVGLIVHAESVGLSYKPSTDLNGYSVALRMGLFTSKLLKKRRVIQELPVKNRVGILQLLCLTSQFANDALVLQEEGTLWSSLLDPEVETEIADFVESSTTSINEILVIGQDAAESTKRDQAETSRQLLLSLIDASKGTSPAAFYAGRVLSKIIGFALSVPEWKDIGSEEWLSSLDAFKASTPNPITVVAILTGLNEALGKSKIVSNLCNRLVSEITDSSPNNERTLCLAICLNATLMAYGSSGLPVAQNRLVFAVKQILSWMDNGHSLSLALAAESCRSLQFLLPSIENVYGPYWQASIDFCLAYWEGAAKLLRGHDMNAWLPVLHASLKLMRTLKQLQNPNEDLREALEGSADRISAGLIQLLRLPRTKDTEPWRIFDESLWRQVVKIPSKHVKDWSVLYPLLASDFRPIQLAAFDVLNKVIPAAQEQISIDVLLEKSGK
jgi:E3 ubiquitin-protein ligase listerin